MYSTNIENYDIYYMIFAIGFFSPALPVEWMPHGEGVRLREMPLLQGNREYNVVADLFSSTMGTRNVRIFDITRIQNVDLWREFSHRRQMFAQQNKPSGDRLTFHGTRDNNPRDIYAGQRGLDIIRSDRGAYGRGIYLAKNALVSHSYTHTTSGLCQMLVMKTLLGVMINNSREGPVQTQQVQGGVIETSDSIQGTLGGDEIYVVHRNDQTYPAYLITYL